MEPNPCSECWNVECICKYMDDEYLEKLIEETEAIDKTIWWAEFINFPPVPIAIIGNDGGMFPSEASHDD